MNKEQIIEMIRDDNTPKELIIAQFEVAFKYQMDLQKNIDILHNNQNKLIDEIGEQDKEIERLNNIINELEKELEQEIAVVGANRTIDNNNPEWWYKLNCYNNILEKLKELKEGK